MPTVAEQARPAYHADPMSQRETLLLVRAYYAILKQIMNYCGPAIGKESKSINEDLEKARVILFSPLDDDINPDMVANESFNILSKADDRISQALFKAGLSFKRRWDSESESMSL